MDDKNRSFSTDNTFDWEDGNDTAMKLCAII